MRELSLSFSRSLALSRSLSLCLSPSLSLSLPLSLALSLSVSLALSESGARHRRTQVLYSHLHGRWFRGVVQDRERAGKRQRGGGRGVETAFSSGALHPCMPPCSLFDTAKSQNATPDSSKGLPKVNSPCKALVYSTRIDFPPSRLREFTRITVLKTVRGETLDDLDKIFESLEVSKSGHQKATNVYRNRTVHGIEERPLSS